MQLCKTKPQWDGCYFLLIEGVAQRVCLIEHHMPDLSGLTATLDLMVAHFLSRASFKTMSAFPR